MQNKSGYAVALGMFDGMHIGHRALVAKTSAFARKNGCKSMVYTFSNHPLSVLGRDPGMLMSVEERIALMKRLGIDEVVMLPFNLEFATIQPEAFLQQLLDHYNMCAAFAGFNYTFGDKGMGDEPLLRKYGKKHDFSVHILSPVLYEEAPVSSSRIRKAILAGRVDQAADMLGEPYMLSGTLSGINRGEREFEFHPSTPKLLPGAGLYASNAMISGKLYHTVTRICPGKSSSMIRIRPLNLPCAEFHNGCSLQLSFLKELGTNDCAEQNVTAAQDYFYNGHE